MVMMDTLTRRELSLLWNIHPHILGPYNNRDDKKADHAWWYLCWPRRKFLALKRKWRYRHDRIPPRYAWSRDPAQGPDGGSDPRLD